ncbi:alkaline phosphatase [Desulfarculales bacterium]
MLEVARFLSKSTGLMATSRITHATPTAFAAHVSQHNQKNAIAKQIAHQGLTVLLDGGWQHFLPQASGGKREDSLDLVDGLHRQGYQTPRNREELAVLRGGRVAWLFALSHLKTDRERAELASDEPSLVGEVGWIIYGHSGSDVPPFAYGPSRPSDLIKTPQAALTVAQVL